MCQTRKSASGPVGNGTRDAFALTLTLQSYFTLGSSHPHVHDPRGRRIWAELVSCHLLSRSTLAWGCIYPPVKGASLLCVSTLAIGQGCWRWVFSAEELMFPVLFGGLCLYHMFTSGLFSIGTKLKFQTTIFIYFLM